EATSIKFTNIICTSYNESWILVNTCRLRALNRYTTTLNFNATLIQPVTETSITFQFLQKANGYKPWLYKYTIDVCRFFKKAYNPVAIMVYKMFKDFTNFNHTCPYETELICDGFYISDDKIPIPWPSGDFQLQMQFTSNKKRLIFVYIYFHVADDL
ncbi:GH22552, partial [Drosophila grimshawi]